MARDLADFKARLPVVDIVQRYVRLSRHGPLHKGLCPFHKEKTPSFTVTASRGTYHCFGCGAHGNALDFLMAMEGLGFAEAVRRAAELTGLEPPVSERHEPRSDRERGLSELLEEANRRFRARLEGGEGDAARAYLARRGVGPGAVARFELGYAGGGRRALTDALGATGAALADLVDAGLVVRPDDGGAVYDRFRDRLMFPIRDARGRLVGFGGRALADGAKAKYLNSPEGPLFKKRELLYGAHGLDRRAGRGRVHVVEGYMDVIALARHGIAALAPLGTAMTEAQLERLWRLDDTPLVCLDGDEAGVRAAGRLAERALAVLKPGRSLTFALLPSGEDPDSLVRAGGAEAFARATAAPSPLVDVLWDKWKRETPGSGPDQAAALKKRILDLKQSLQDASIRSAYVDHLFARLRQDTGRERATSASRSATLSRRRGGGSQHLESTLRSYIREDVQAAVLHYLRCRPELIDDAESYLAATSFVSESFQAVADSMLDFNFETGSGDLGAVQTYLSRAMRPELLQAFEAQVAKLTKSGFEIELVAEHVLGLEDRPAGATRRHGIEREAELAEQRQSRFASIYRAIAQTSDPSKNGAP
jgi:DNA primase